MMQRKKAVLYILFCAGMCIGIIFLTFIFMVFNQPKELVHQDKLSSSKPEESFTNLIPPGYFSGYIESFDGRVCTVYLKSISHVSDEGEFKDVFDFEKFNIPPEFIENGSKITANIQNGEHDIDKASFIIYRGISFKDSGESSFTESNKAGAEPLTVRFSDAQLTTNSEGYVCIDVHDGIDVTMNLNEWIEVPSTTKSTNVKVWYVEDTKHGYFPLYVYLDGTWYSNPKFKKDLGGSE